MKLGKMLTVALAVCMLFGMFTFTGASASEIGEPFAEQVLLKVPVYDRGVEGVPTVNDNFWTRWIQTEFGDKYNIKVEYVPITRSAVMTDYSLLAASDSLPTILMEYDYPKLSQWANDGYLTTFDMEAFKEVAPTYYKQMADNNQLTYTEMNGETYFALALRPNWNTGYTWQTFVRMDWLRAVGYDHIPANYAELIDAMEKIKAEGIAEYPFGGSLVTGTGSDQNYAFRDHPEDETEWAMYSSVSIPMLAWEPAYRYLKRANAEYNSGLTHPEYYMTTAEEDKARFVNGETYRFGAYVSANMDWLNAFYENNPGAELAVDPVASEPDVEAGTTPAYRADNPFGMIVGFSSKATEDQLKAAWMYMEWLAQPENLFTFQWGFEGENYTVDAETGLPVAVGGYEGEFKQGYNNSKDYWCVVIEARNAGTIEQQIASMSPKGLPQDFTQQIIDNYYRRVEAAAAGYTSNDPIFSVAIPEESEYSAALVELYKEYRDKLTLCSPDEFDDLYAELSQKFLDAGFQKVIDARLAAYEAGNSTKLPK